MPASQGVQLAVPPLETLPLAQSVHALAEAALYLPAAQLSHTPLPAYVPAVHAVHPPEPAAETLPAAQGEHTLLPSDLAKVFTGQAAQVTLPVPEAILPSGHAVHEPPPERGA